MPNSDFRVQGVPAIAIERLWPFAEPYIKRALEHASGELVPEDFKRFCLNRDVQLWLVSSGARVVGAATTEIVIYPQRKHCRIITVAGSDFPYWVQLLDDTLSAWAAQMECDAMESHVRKGLVPKMIPLGYKHRHSVVVKELRIIAPKNTAE